jgi:hypothetical protein
MLTQHLNSKANAGLRPGATVTKAASIYAFFDELDKIADAGHIAELAGLGILAAPSVKTLADPNASKKEKSHAKFETAGLGVLAAPSAYKLLTKKAARLYTPDQLKTMMLQHGRDASYRASMANKGVEAPPPLRGQPMTFSAAQLGGSPHDAPLQLARPVRTAPKPTTTRPIAAPAARSSGVMSRISKFFKGV